MRDVLFAIGQTVRFAKQHTVPARDEHHSGEPILRERCGNSAVYDALEWRCAATERDTQQRDNDLHGVSATSNFQFSSGGFGNPYVCVVSKFVTI